MQVTGVNEDQSVDELINLVESVPPLTQEDSDEVYAMLTSTRADRRSSRDAPTGRATNRP